MLTDVGLKRLLPRLLSFLPLSLASKEVLGEKETKTRPGFVYQKEQGHKAPAGDLE